MNKQEILMILNSVKKHSVRYDSIDKDDVVRSIYIMKTAFAVGEKFPDKIKITIEEEL
jgi:hypothetical protein